MNTIEPNKLKVVELRAELNARGLDSRGVKAVLVERLEKALKEEGDGNFNNQTDKNQEDIKGESGVKAALDLDQTAESELDTSAMTENAELKEKNSSSAVINSTETSKPILPTETKPAEENNKPLQTESVPETESRDNTKQPAPNVPSLANDANADGSESKNENKPTELLSLDSEKMETDESSVKPEAKENGEQPMDESGEPVLKKKEGDASDVEILSENVGEKRRRTSSGSPDRKRQRGRSKERRKSRSPSRSPTPRTVVEEEDDTFDDSLVVLDWYNSDLNLVIENGRYSASPLSTDGFAFMWAGVRATYGFGKGKIVYEVKITKQHDVNHLPSDEVNPHVVRVGCSTEGSSTQLGEEPFSYGYGGTGKKSTNCQFEDYGEEFKADDVIACFINLEVDPVEISYAKNGNHLGTAFTIPKSELGERPLFPHVLTKNCSFHVNFGQEEQPFSSLPESFQDFVFCHKVAAEDKVRGIKAPAKREECEIIMMCGLPGSGKTTWTEKYISEHPEKIYNILGTNNIIDKMKVMGLPRKRNYSGRWEVLIEKSTKCLNRLLEIGSRRRRNYILDQTNVYASAQRRKMRPFEGFIRRAVVLVPTDEELKSRIAKRDKEEGKDVPESAVLEMKESFTLPEVGPLFNEVQYVELAEPEAKILVEQYVKEGKAAKPPAPMKKYRAPNEQRFSRGGSRFGPPNQQRDRPGFRGGRDDRRFGRSQMRNFGNDRGGGHRGGNMGRGGGGQFRNAPPHRGYGGGGGGGFGRGGPGRGGGGMGSRGGGGGGDRRSGGTNNRSGGGGGRFNDRDKRGGGGGGRFGDRNSRGGGGGGGGGNRRFDRGGGGGGRRDMKPMGGGGGRDGRWEGGGKPRGGMSRGGGNNAGGYGSGGNAGGGYARSGGNASGGGGYGGRAGGVVSTYGNQSSGYSQQNQGHWKSGSAGSGGGYGQSSYHSQQSAGSSSTPQQTVYGWGQDFHSQQWEHWNQQNQYYNQQYVNPMYNQSSQIPPPQQFGGSSSGGGGGQMTK